MLIHASLTNLGLAAFILVVLVVTYLYCHRRWRAAAARREEVRRLTWLAAKEAERVETEAAEIAYVPPPIVIASLFESGVRVDSIEVRDGTVMQQCAVCYRHTTTRCSRCKAVRYCSGKCQIIHWRQGHKNECHPPKVDDKKNDEESTSSAKGSDTNHTIISENHVDIKTNGQSKPSKILHAESSEHISQTTCDYCVHISSSSSSLSSLSDNDVISDDHQVFNSDEIQKSSNHRVLSKDQMLNDKTDNDVCASSSVNNLSSQDNIEHSVPINKICSGISEPMVQKSSIDEQKTHNSKADSINRSSLDSTNMHKNAIPPGTSDGIMNSPHNNDAESSYRASSEQISLEVGYENKDHPYKKASSESTTDTDNSSCTANGKSTDVWLLKAKSAKSASTESSLDTNSFVSLNMSSHSNITSSKIDKTPYTFSKSAETKCSTPSDVSELKTYIRKIPQQLAQSNILKHSSGVRTDISQKHKILFPYDLFVKLYNCDKVEMQPSGLINCGNSCYANAVLQCLAFTRPLTSYLLKGLHNKICRKEDWCFTCEFESLLKKTKLGQSPLSPALILLHIQNNGCTLGHGKEEDAHEFLRYAIDIMQSVCLKETGIQALESRAEETTLIQLIFGGYLHSKIKCTGCRGISERHERMMDLTVEINGIETLEEALTRFTSTEVLDGENRYQCGRCKSYERAKKKLTILEAPNVLTITLKRFQSGKFGKLNKAVRFPEVLNLAPYMHATDDKSPVYSLYAVVVHQDIMNATFSGHYISYVKSAQGKWYKTDDSRVKLADLGTVLSKNVYILFYARCSPRAPSLYRSSKLLKDRILSRSFRLNGKFPFRRTDSYSEISSTFSNSDEGSCSTESSTRESCISTDELPDYSRSCSNSEYSHVSVHGEDNGLNYGEGLGWGRSRDHASPFLSSDMSNNGCNSSSNVEGRKLTVDCRSGGSDRLSNGECTLVRRVLPTSKEGRVRLFY